MAGLITVVPTSANIKYYVRIVQEKATLRRLIAVGENLVNSCYTDAENIDEVLNGIESDVLKISQNKDDGKVVLISQIVMDTLNKIESLMRVKYILLLTVQKASTPFDTKTNKTTTDK